MSETPKAPQWREDFPVDWAEDRYVERRDFVKFLVLISGAFVAGQAWIVAQNWLRRRRGAAELRRIATFESLAVGQTLVFDYPRPHDACILVRLSESEFVAYSQKCTHLSCAVIPRPEQGVIVCPCHDGLFDLKTGRQLAGPPPRPLPRVILEIRGREIYAAGIETRAS